MDHVLSFTEGREILQQHEHAPFLMELKEGAENELHVTICPAVIGEKSANHESFGDIGIDAALDEILADCSPILPEETRQYEIVFPDYIIYQVRNESFCSFDPEEVWSGRYLVVFEQSKFLDALPVFTDAQELEDGTCYPGPWKHYGIYTQNQVIDVIAQVEPTILEKLL